MIVDGTNDDLICIDGVETYTFTDADAGDLPVNAALVSNPFWIPNKLVESLRWYTGASFACGVMLGG